MSANQNSQNSNPPPKEGAPPAPQPQTQKQASPAQPPQEKKDLPPPKQKYTALWVLSLIVLLIAIGWFCLWYFYLQYRQYTDDAYANGNYININAAVPGSVTAFYADDTDLVKQGQLLVSLDPTNYHITFERELATLAEVVLQVRQLYTNVYVNRANVENQRANLTNVSYDYENRLHLVGSLAISDQEFVHAKNTLLIAQYTLKQAEYQLQAAIDLAGPTPPDIHPQILQQRGNVRAAYYNLQHCSIYAPSTGYVAQRNVDVGQWVTPTTNMMVVIPTDYMWVDANYKETQLTYMRIGQPAKVWFDIYGSKVEYHGKVIGIASGSGSVFSLIPPQNATGNWIKIVQRLPVRISLPADLLEKYPARLGISAEVDVDITNYENLPMLAQVPPLKAVSTTDVFDIDMENLDVLMDQIVAENLKNKQVER